MNPSNLKNQNWRINNLYKIVDKNQKLITFKRTPIQETVAASQSKRKMILKARQFGFTTDAVIAAFDACIWNPNTTAVILAHKQSVLEKIFKIVKIAYKNLPPTYQPRLDKGGGSMYEYRFPEINSTIYTSIEVRGGTINRLHISERAFIPEDRIRATIEAVPLYGHITQETTANGLNEFYDKWIDKTVDYEKFFFPWFFHHEYKLPIIGKLELTSEELDLIDSVRSRYNLTLSPEQIQFRRFKIREQGSLSNFRQEYPEDDQTCFLASGNNPFDTFKLKQILENVSDSTMDGEFKIYKQKESKKNYVIGADTAEGVRKDYSTATVICVEDKEEVAFFRSNTVKPHEFAEHLTRLGKLYNNARIIPERNNHGHAVISHLLNVCRYGNIWKDRDELPGHRTTAISRPLLIDTFIEAVEDGIFKINSKEIISECLTLVDNNGKIEAESGKHDDSVISTALAIKLALEYLPKINIYKNIDSYLLV